jgi:hypothetical protein
MLLAELHLDEYSAGAGYTRCGNLTLDTSVFLCARKEGFLLYDSSSININLASPHHPPQHEGAFLT